MGMDEKVDEVLKQYELDIRTRRRVRGSVVIESGDRFYVVKPYLGDETNIFRGKRKRTVSRKWI